MFPSCRKKIVNHKVEWHETFELQCSIRSDNGRLIDKNLTISVRKVCSRKTVHFCGSVALACIQYLYLDMLVFMCIVFNLYGRQCVVLCSSVYVLF